MSPAAKSSAYERRPQVMVEASCGSATHRLAELTGQGGHIIGVDIAAKMICATQAAALSRTVRNVETQRMDAESLAYPDDAFDFATCAFGLIYAPSPEAALVEMTRVTGPGGRIAVAVWGRRANCGWAEVFPVVDAHVQSDICLLFFRSGAGDALAMAMCNVGLHHIETSRLDLPLVLPSEQAAISAFLSGGAVALAYNRFDAATRRAVAGGLLATLVPYRIGAAYVSDHPCRKITSSRSIGRSIVGQPTGGPCTAQPQPGAVGARASFGRPRVGLGADEVFHLYLRKLR